MKTATRFARMVLKIAPATLPPVRVTKMTAEVIVVGSEERKKIPVCRSEFQLDPMVKMIASDKKGVPRKIQNWQNR